MKNEEYNAKADFRDFSQLLEKLRRPIEVEALADVAMPERGFGSR